MLKNLKKKIIDIKATANSFFYTILLGIILAMIIIFVLVKYRVGAIGAEYVFGVASLLLAITFLVSVIKTK